MVKIVLAEVEGPVRTDGRRQQERNENENEARYYQDEKLEEVIKLVSSDVPDGPPGLRHRKDREEHPRNVHPVDPHVVTFANETTQARE